MQKVVKVTRRGQTTIPEEFRRKYDIQEGDSLLVEDENGKIVIRTIKSLLDLGGVDSEFGTPKQLKAEVEKLRKEYR
ncbi:MAG: AbrB/MazE/SpoVT family DNA-binding domain-containing protein [Thermoplasmata archaeon]|nr:AbrB/MazE/SpoVT family DNA-binding domain-containing protein [Thermoplasmata archaeon]